LIVHWRCTNASRKDLLSRNPSEPRRRFRFYSEIFGWKVRERGDGNLAFDDTGGVSGTWVKESDRTPDERTRTYIMVDSIATSLDQIEKSGGKTLTPRTDIDRDMGAFAVFTDPVGNGFGLYEEPKR